MQPDCVNQGDMESEQSTVATATEHIKNEKGDGIARVPWAEREKLWSKVREAVAMGMSIRDAAARFGVGYHAARKRARVDEWATPNRLKRAQIQLEKSPQVAEVVAASLLERGEKFRARLLDRAEASIEAAELKPLEDWRDAKLALDIVDTITGLNKPQAATNILISGAGAVSIDGQSTAESPFYRPLPDSTPETSEEPASEGQVIDVDEQW